MDVLSSTEISREVLSLIEGARKFVFLVSAYYDPWDRLTNEIKSAAVRPGVNVVLLLRGGDDRAKHEARAADVARVGVKVEYLNRLHAKVYISEKQAIVTSMNLLKSSALDSWEVALRVEREHERSYYDEILKHSAELLRRATVETEVAQREQLQREAEFIVGLSGTPPSRRAPPVASKQPVPRVGQPTWRKARVFAAATASR